MTCLLTCSEAQSLAGALNHSFENRFESKGIWHLNPVISYYKTSLNYDANGNNREIGNGFNAYTRFQIDVNLTYGLFQDFAFYGRLSWALSHLDHTTLTGDNYGLADQTAGITYRVKRPNPNAMGVAGMSVDLQSQLDFPVYSNSSARLKGTPYLGEGNLDWTTGAFLSLPISRSGTYSYWMTAGGGFTYRSANYSSQLPWSVQFQMVPEKSGFMAGLGATGFQSLKTDTFANLSPPTRGTVGAGGSFYINGINPSQATIQGIAGMRLNPKNSIYLGLNQTFYGQAAPKSFTLFLGFQARFGDNQKGPALPGDENYEKSNRGFLAYGLEATVTKTNERLSLIKIDKGTLDGLKPGMTFDIFKPHSDEESQKAVARAKITNVKPSESSLKITEFFNEVWIEEGFVAKQPID